MSKEARREVWDELAKVEESCLWEPPEHEATATITYLPSTGWQVSLTATAPWNYPASTW